MTTSTGHGSPTSPFSTRFSDILETNYAPSKEELHEIRAIAHDPEEEMRRIDEEIGRLQARRDELQHFVGRHRRLLSPFRRFPEDLWGEVFIRCLPDKHLPVRRVLEAPLILTVICRSWRDIALRTPRLWNSLHLTLPSPSVVIDGEDLLALLESRKEGVKLWLERSGALPLNLSVMMDIPLGQVGSRADNYSDCIGTIAEYCMRWRSISLFNITPSAVNRFIGMSPGDLPLLEAFSDIGPDTHRMFPPSHPQPAFFHAVGNSPSLRKLRTTIRTTADLNHSIRWRHLRLLEIQVYLGFPECVSLIHGIVESCPLLLDCIVQFSIQFSHPPQSDDSIAHHREWYNLRRLGITFDGFVNESFQSTVLNVFESLTIPGLTHLSLSLPIVGSESERDSDLPFHNLISRSRCNLESLELQMSYGTGLQRTLGELTSLITLSISRPSLVVYVHGDEPNSVHLDAEVTRTLVASEGSVRCPNVERLILRRYHPQQAFALVELIESRARSTGLKSFKVDFGDIRSKKSIQIVTSALASLELKQLSVEVEWKFRDPYATSGGGGYVRLPGADHDSFIL
ncbi:hypothetical protein PM082_022884 [Marasmius tenuissimus]|nr:hypothetical protein PM082_022884 [Marasmius tenuissimus]